MRLLIPTLFIFSICSELFAAGQEKLLEQSEIVDGGIIDYFETRANTVDVLSMYFSAELYSDKQDFDKAYYWYEKAARQGNAEAQEALAVMYSLGTGVKQDDYQTLHWAQKAAAQGSPMAQVLLGGRYGQGKGVRQDKKLEHYWFGQASVLGHDVGKTQRDLGIIYSGLGQMKTDVGSLPTNADCQQAAYWLEKAAERGRGFLRRGKTPLHELMREVDENTAPILGNENCLTKVLIRPFIELLKGNEANGSSRDPAKHLLNEWLKNIFSN